jgi:putative heme iron utilization protein
MSTAAERAPDQEWSPETAARNLLRTARRGALSTLDAGSGFPYASLVGIASDSNGAPLLLLSRLARHTANLEADSRASVLLASEGARDPLANPRITVLGRLGRAEEPRVRQRYLARHPEATGYAAFADFSMFRLEVESAHLVAGFGRIVDLDRSQLLSDLSDAEELVEAEPRIAEHMNEDHADAVLLYATKLLGAEPGDWRFEGCDPDGCDLGLKGAALRLPFPRRATTATEVRIHLVELVRQARAVG